MRCSEIINNCSKEEINVFSKRVTNTNRVIFTISLKSSEKEQIESKLNKSDVSEFLNKLLALYITNVDVVSLPMKSIETLQPRKKKKQGREYVTKSFYIEADTFLKIKKMSHMTRFSMSALVRDAFISVGIIK